MLESPCRFRLRQRFQNGAEFKPRAAAAPQNCGAGPPRGRGGHGGGRVGEREGDKGRRTPRCRRFPRIFSNPPLKSASHPGPRASRSLRNLPERACGPEGAEPEVTSPGPLYTAQLGFGCAGGAPQTVFITPAGPPPAHRPGAPGSRRPTLFSPRPPPTPHPPGPSSYFSDLPSTPPPPTQALVPPRSWGS